MSWSWKIFSAFGIPVRLHISMLLLPVIAFTWVEGNSLSSWIVAGVLAVLLFASVIAHEFGHALMGRRFGVKTEDIVLTPIGGMARMRNIPTNPSQEIAIAIAGPLVSFAVALGAWLFVSAAPVMPLAPRLILGAAAVLYELNLTLALFNLIPALPMDGGRVFRGILSLRMGHTRATIVASRVGRVLAIAGGIWGVVRGQWSLAIIAWFIYSFARQEQLYAMHLEAMEQAVRQGTVRAGSLVVQGGKVEVISRRDPPSSN